LGKNWTDRQPIQPKPLRRSTRKFHEPKGDGYVSMFPKFGGGVGQPAIRNFKYHVPKGDGYVSWVPKFGGGGRSVKEISGELIEKNLKGQPSQPKKISFRSQKEMDMFQGFQKLEGSGSASQKQSPCASLVATRTSTHAKFLLFCN